MLKTMLLLSLACFLLSAVPVLAENHPRAGRSVVMARHGMVATSQPLAAQIGLDVLQARAATRSMPPSPPTPRSA